MYFIVIEQRNYTWNRLYKIYETMLFPSDSITGIQLANKKI